MNFARLMERMSVKGLAVPCVRRYPATKYRTLLVQPGITTSSPASKTRSQLSACTLKVNGCRSHIDVGTLRHAAPGCPVICVSRLTGHRHSGIRVFSHAPHTPEGSPHASIAEPCLLVQ